MLAHETPGPINVETEPAPQARRALENLLDDAERCEGALERSAVDRTYDRRKLSIADCAWVETQLLLAGVEIVEADDEDAAPVDPAARREAPWSKAKYLTDAEERDCGRKLKLLAKTMESAIPVDPAFIRRLEQDARDARDRLVLSNTRYVWQLAGRFGARRHLHQEDLFQEGVCGLMRAAELYDPDLGFKFKTYATWWVRQKMHRAAADQDRSVRVPVHVQERMRRLKKAERTFRLQNGRLPSAGELADFVGEDRERLATLIWSVEATECVEGDILVGEGTSLLSLQRDDEALDACDLVARHELEQILKGLLEAMPARYAYVLRARFGLEDGITMTLEQIGQIYGVTRERIRQIEAKALSYLRHPLRRRRLASFLETTPE